MDLDSRQFKCVRLRLDEFVPIDQSDCVVAICINLYTLAHQSCQGRVHIPALNHASVDMHNHAVIIPHIGISDVVRLITGVAERGAQMGIGTGCEGVIFCGEDLHLYGHTQHYVPACNTG